VDPMRLDDIVAATRGRLARGRPEMSIGSISTDSRAIQPGELFVALVGDRFDGHAFVADAFARGAAAVVVESDRLPDGRAQQPAIVVENTTRALQDVARANRQRHTCTVVAVTGSNGKTTTKEFIAALASQRFRTIRNKSSFNNHVGVPLTLLDIDHTTELGVVEIGMSAPGEIRSLATIAQPQVGVITNVTPAHLEFFGSVAAIAEAKAELLDALDAKSTAVLNADDKWVRRIGERWTGRRVTFGEADEANVHLTALRQTGDGTEAELSCFGGPSFQTVLPFPGKHNALNAAAAVATCCALGMQPDEAVRGLSKLTLPTMRFEPHEWRGALLINDAYNANPESMRAALLTFEAMPVEGRRVFVCGEMRELGAHSLAAHRELGRLVVERSVERLLTTGGDARHVTEAAIGSGMPADRATDCGSVAQAAACLQKELRPGDAVLIKGSRANEMERIVDELAAGTAAPRHG